MLTEAPAVGTSIAFTFGEAKPRTWKGEVIEIVHDEDGPGMRVAWPTMRYEKKKGVVCYHSFPNYTLELLFP